MKINERKKNHIDVCMNEDVSFKKTNGFEKYDFLHNALPEINFKDISTKTEFLGKELDFPLIISGMTGGPELSYKVNKNLAIAAEKCKVAMGVGSQRVIIEEDKLGKENNKNENSKSVEENKIKKSQENSIEKDSKISLKESFQVRKYFSGPLLANLGAVQLNYGYGINECKKAIKLIDADALVFHLNSMQEVIQNGDTNFKDLIPKIEKIVKELNYPVLVKEVGFGISGENATFLNNIGIHAIDVSGTGGTSWSAVESYTSGEPYKSLGKLFWNWGIPTANCLEQIREIKRAKKDSNQEHIEFNSKIIAGGGIRNGIEIAKAIALGADYVTIAGPLFKAAMESSDKVVEVIEKLKLELKTAMFGIGVSSLDGLRESENLVRKD